MMAPLDRVTRVQRAWDFIVTRGRQRYVQTTFQRVAGILGACDTVVTPGSRRQIQAPQVVIAGIDGTCHAVVAIPALYLDAKTIDATIVDRARIPVVARIRVIQIIASKNRVARVGGTDVAIIAMQYPSQDAPATSACVAGCTGITVVALQLVVLVLTATQDITRVGRAYVVVVAINKDVTDAASGNTSVENGAGIPVAANHP
jgi:hypothetical protein